jgi:hypothetical protein
MEQQVKTIWKMNDAQKGLEAFRHSLDLAGRDIDMRRILARSSPDLSDETCALRHDSGMLRV